MIANNYDSEQYLTKVTELTERDLFRLNNATNKEINNYIYCRYKQLKFISTLDNNMIISNTFNDTKIILPKFLYQQ